MSDSNYAEWRSHTEKRFSQMSPTDTPPEMYISPSGNYSLEIIEYTEGPQSWNFSRGLVRDTVSQKVIADVKRNLAGSRGCCGPTVNIYCAEKTTKGTT